MKLASIAKILACKNRLWKKCSLSLQDTSLVRFLLHESKLKCMSEKKYFIVEFAKRLKVGKNCVAKSLQKFKLLSFRGCSSVSKGHNHTTSA